MVKNMAILSLSVGKCFHIRYGLTLNKNVSLYNVNGFALNTVTELRDICVMMDSRLNFTNHVTLLVSRANQILRCFISNDRILLTKAFLLLMPGHCLNIVLRCGLHIK